MKRLYKIGEVSNIKNIDIQTLRYYDKIGLFSPAIIDSDTGYRYYTIEQFVEIDKIKFYKKIGLSLNEMIEYKKVSSLDKSLDILQKQKEYFDFEIKKLQVISNNIDNIIEDIKRAKDAYEKIGSKIEIRYCDPLIGIIGDCEDVKDWYQFENKLLELTKKYPNYSEIGHNHGLTFIHDGNFLLTSYGDNIKKIILPVDKTLIDNPNVQEYKLGNCICVYFMGNITDFNQILVPSLKQYVESNNIQIRGDIVTTTIAGSFIVHNSSEHITEIKIPVL
ncbi:helix-turn-helix domain-containing protein [Clostridiaceae bacterium M8S5]|nr:helix-turn-helix domain-containing protein [Clostridiaceae bacterium M8S5]